MGSSSVSPHARPVLAYSPALDGIRAVAVGAVLLYHGGVAWLPGGFLGVDLFFVLSGFLILSLLLLEWEARGGIDIPAFWGRRVRRLLPALLLLLAGLAVIGIAFGAEYSADLRGDGLAALFYVSNWWFIAQGDSYADQFGEPSPLQHTWSLAIEEQWYLLLPLVLVLLLPRLRRRSTLALLLAGAAAASALWMAVLGPADGSDPARAYYGTDTRVQALLVGGVLACLAPMLGRRRPSAPAATATGLAALAASAVAFAVVTYRSELMYRGGYLLVAAVFALLIASVTARPDSPVARLSAAAPLVAMGKISYGLYLYHWPVYLILAPERVGLGGVSLLALRLAVTFAIATLSYLLIEKPIRRGALARLPAPRRAAVALAVPAAVGVALVVAPRVAPPPSQASLTALAANAAEAGPPVEETPGVSAVIVGDSQALALQTQLDPADAPGLTTGLVTEFGCGVVPYDSAVAGVRLPVDDKCHRWTPAVIAAKVGPFDADVGVLMAGSWEQYDRWIGTGSLSFREPAWSRLLARDYERLLRVLHRHTDHVALILDQCHRAPQFDVPLEAQFGAGRYPPVTNDPERVAAVNTAARTAARAVDFPVEIIDLNPLLCVNGYTEAVDGAPLRTDGLHLTEAGASVVWRNLAPRLIELAGSGQSPSAAPGPPS